MLRLLSSEPDRIHIFSVFQSPDYHSYQKNKILAILYKKINKEEKGLSSVTNFLFTIGLSHKPQNNTVYK